MSDRESIAAIILAAGASRRLGGPKQLVRVAGETLLGRTIRVVRESGVNSILVVLGAYCEEIQAGVEMQGVRTVMNPAWGKGIASSIRAGMKALDQAAPGAQAVLLLVCDQPNLTAQHLCVLMNTYEHAAQSNVVASRYAGVTGIPVIFPAALFPRLLALEGDEGARRLLRDPDLQPVCVDFSGGEIDIDTLADLARTVDSKLSR
jgi:molybdenum cofactor cytidylyltransferase